MHNNSGMHSEPTVAHFIMSLLIFSSKFHSSICHLKDLGEKDLNLTALMDEFENRILYGDEAKLEEFPFVVQFFNYGGLCGGSILTRKTVLTAAHCFDHNTNIAEMKIVANALYKFERKSRSHEVWNYAVHESYNIPTKFSNDIALIIIHDVFVFNTTVQKVILTNSDKWMSEGGTDFVAVGWGLTKWRRGILMKTKLRYISPQNCTQMSGLPIADDMFCLFGDDKTDTCRGDSGGGVLWHDLLVGIVSHGHGCLHTPSAYVNIYFFRNWIKNNVNQMYKQYCNFHSVNTIKLNA